jgi:iron complex transport system substrate-binding protein
MNMNRRSFAPVFYTFTASLLVFFLISCTAPQNNQRIISLSPSHTEVLYALGLQNQIVGWTQYCNYPPEVQDVPGWARYDQYLFSNNEDELKKKIPVVSSFTDVNFDLIEILKPTLILACHQMQKDIADQLKAKGYKVLFFSPVTLEDVFVLIEEVGKATGKENIARKLTAGYRAEIEKIKAITKDLPEIAVYFEINHMGPYVLGSGSPMDQMLAIAGGVNIFEDVKSEAFRADPNEIIKRNPDVIFTPLWPFAGKYEVTDIREIMMRPGFENTRAVQNSRVYFYDSSLLKRPGPRQITAIKKLAYLLHPYYFKNPENSVDPWELGKIDATYPPPRALK